MQCGTYPTISLGEADRQHQQLSPSSKGNSSFLSPTEEEIHFDRESSPSPHNEHDTFSPHSQIPSDEMESSAIPSISALDIEQIQGDLTAKKRKGDIDSLTSHYAEAIFCHFKESAQLFLETQQKMPENIKSYYYFPDCQVKGSKDPFERAIHHSKFMWAPSRKEQYALKDFLATPQYKDHMEKMLGCIIRQTVAKLSPKIKQEAEKSKIATYKVHLLTSNDSLRHILSNKAQGIAITVTIKKNIFSRCAFA